MKIHLFVSFRDTTGVIKELDITSWSEANNMTENEAIAAWINSGMVEVSSRYADVETPVPAPLPGQTPVIIPGTTIPSGSGCILPILVFVVSTLIVIVSYFT